MDEKVISTAELLQKFDISQPTLIKLTRAGDLKPIKKRGRIRIWYKEEECRQILMERLKK